MNEAGTIVLDLPPGPHNPRNSEGAFYSVDENQLFFIFSRFNGDSGADNAPAGLAIIRSSDGGRTWSEPKMILTAENDHAQNIMSVSMLPMSDGSAGLFYFIRRGFDYGKIHLRRSYDQGQTWSDPVCCIPAFGYYVTNNDRIIRLQSGRIIIPAGYHRTLGEQGSADHWRHWDGHSISYFFYSDDDGQTWKESNLCALNSRYTQSGLQEPGCIELNNGSVYGWARTDQGVQYEMFSIDQGATWSVPAPSRFSSPCSPMSIKRVPNDGRLLAVWNPIPSYNGRKIAVTPMNGGRTPLVIATSDDDGITWSEPREIESDPDSGYCYTAIHFHQDDILLAYCAGSTADGGCLNRLRIRKLSRSDL